VLDVIETVKRVSGVDFKIEFAARPAGDPADLVAACDRAHSSNGSRVLTICEPLSPTRWDGSASYKRLPAPFDANPAGNDGDPLTASGESVAIR
jgi:hypothetical protein